MPVIILQPINNPTTYAAVILADNPLHYWRLGEASGSVGVDEVSGSNGTYSAGIVTAPGLIANDTDTAAVFNTGDYMTIPVVNNAGDYTLECWVNFNSITATWQSFFYTSTVNVFGIYIGVLNFYTNTNNLATTTLSTNTTYHLAYVKTGSTGEFFINGVSDGTIAVSTETGFNSIGARETSAEPLSGTMDEAAIYDYALTPAQLLAHYNAGI